MSKLGALYMYPKRILNLVPFEDSSQVILLTSLAIKLDMQSRVMLDRNKSYTFKVVARTIRVNFEPLRRNILDIKLLK